jgi:acyl-CoA synthetase (AMP-forming)/AMP-acid ligase II
MTRHAATSLNLSSIVEHHAAQTPDRLAVVFDERCFTYGQLNALASQVANGLVARGIQPGDHVALSCPSLPFFKKDLILRGGMNVYPRKLEETLLTHAAVSLAAVIGVPDDRPGEEVMAVVVRKPGADLTEAELVAWCREQFAAYKYPRRIEFRDRLPIGPTGKILERELKTERAR